MTLKTKFNVGDTVWITATFAYSREHSCGACEATGKVKLAKGKMQKCYTCGGTKKHFRKFPFMGRSVKTTVTMIRITVKGKRPAVTYQLEWDMRAWNDYCRYDEADLVSSFAKSRKLTRAFNKKYKWPKKDYELNANYPVIREHNFVYWGYRTKDAKVRID